jgi:mannose-6-phosphate isomerase-like protein (cupin superfamily)
MNVLSVNQNKAGMNKVSLLEKFDQVTDHWNPKIVGALNGQHVKLIKFQGPFTWHFHEHEDELFYVVKGSFVMELRDQNILLTEGDFLIVPKGVEHRPNAEAEVWVMLFEPAGTLNTGNTQNEFTQNNPETI